MLSKSIDDLVACWMEISQEKDEQIRYQKSIDLLMLEGVAESDTRTRGAERRAEDTAEKARAEDGE